jgi:hypothetical protein
MITSTQNVTIPRVILAVLGECLDAGLVPSIRQGTGGNSHSVWFISFNIYDGKKHHLFEIKTTASYSKFLEFYCFYGFKENDFFPGSTLKRCIDLAKKQVSKE